MIGRWRRRLSRREGSEKDWWIMAAVRLIVPMSVEKKEPN